MLFKDKYRRDIKLLVAGSRFWEDYTDDHRRHPEPSIEGSEEVLDERKKTRENFHRKKFLAQIWPKMLPDKDEEPTGRYFLSK